MKVVPEATEPRRISVNLSISSDMEAKMKKTGETHAFQDDIEKLAGIFTELVDELNAFTASFETSGKELEKSNTGKAPEESTAQIIVPLVDALNGIGTILNKTTTKVMEMTTELSGSIEKTNT